MWRGLTITQAFGVKNSNYRLGYHPGTDFRFSLGQHQPAFASGIARFQRDTGGGYGNTGTITLPNGDVIYYAHLKENGILVPSGSKVTEGQPVFVTGNTGWVEGVHAHVEYRIGGNQNTPVDITKKLSEEDMITKDDVGPVRIVMSESEGWNGHEIHSGKHDGLIMGAWVGKRWQDFITHTWNVQKVKRHDLLDQLSATNRKIAEMQNIINSLSDRPTKEEYARAQAQINDCLAEVTKLETERTEDTKLLNEGKSAFSWITKLIERLK